jgi:ribosomal protection tetracycline resistance protein
MLLEPVLELRLRIPAECTGRIISDANAMRGEVVHVDSADDYAAVTALVPASECLDYPTRLSVATAGKGGMSVRLNGYRECPLELGAVASRRNVDPLDTSKYILAARSALEGGIFDL